MSLALDLSIVEEMHRDYMSGMTLCDVAAGYGYKSGTTILYHFQRRGLVTRPRGGAIKESQKGDQNGNWKGGVVAGKKQYVRLWMPQHHRADSLGYVFEHVVIAEKSVGRSLAASEVVHHINGVKNDNRAENLMVCINQSEHAKLHRRMK